MILLPPRLTRTDTLFPYTTLFRSAFFARNNIQIWSVDVDEDLNVFLQPIKDTGTRSAGSVRSYGNNDLFYLDDSGIRSIQIGRATSELQSLMRISYAVFCLKKKKQITTTNKNYCNNISKLKS